MSLMDGIDFNNRQLFFDSYFVSIQLLYRLWKQNISTTGTIYLDRKYFPFELNRSEKLERGDYRYLTCNRVYVIKWMDRREVLVASNYSDPVFSNKVSRQSKNGSRKQMFCPLAIVQYNKYTDIKGISDQKIKHYAINRKAKRN